MTTLELQARKFTLIELLLGSEDEVVIAELEEMLNGVYKKGIAGKRPCVYTVDQIQARAVEAKLSEQEGSYISQAEIKRRMKV